MAAISRSEAEGILIAPVKSMLRYAELGLPLATGEPLSGESPPRAFEPGMGGGSDAQAAELSRWARSQSVSRAPKAAAAEVFVAAPSTAPEGLPALQKELEEDEGAPSSFADRGDSFRF
mmetsp:Transcript_46536/g.84009  ORF Transcript_46536/g.84009 Transcript_46536/m.84009 type:complete len:119 (+) Transcript_46536:243-599(+)